MNSSTNNPSQSAKKQDIVVIRFFDAPVELVWKAWTDPELVMLWWGPTNYTSPLCKIDFREGGKYLFCMRAPKEQGGQDYYNTGVYTKIIPLERLEFTQSLCDKDGNLIDPVEIGMPSDFPRTVNFEIDFIEKDAQTKLTIKEYNWTLGQMYDYAVAGMNQSLDKLAKSIE
jgi:uncharacterized protein YndB with AHSA1/START domain